MIRKLTAYKSFDAQFGYWAVEGDPPAEVANTMDDFAWTAGHVAHVGVCP